MRPQYNGRFMGTKELRARVIRAQQPLSGDSIHVWHTALSTIVPLSDELVAVLSPEERARSEKFRFLEHRLAFIASHALLRMVLGTYCLCAPESLQFSFGDQGKPMIDTARTHLQQTVSFNLSHSTKALAIAVAAEEIIGIDVEDPGRDFDVEGLISECLTQEEQRRLSNLSPAQRRNAFLRYWVHKEAFLKCVGTGFTVSPKEVHVRFGPGADSEMSCSNPLAHVALFGRDLQTLSDHLAAIATAKRDCQIEFIAL